MPTKRTPIARPGKARITEEMIELWRHRYDDRGAVRKIERLYGRKPWDMPLAHIDADAEGPTEMDKKFARGGVGWYQGRDLVRALNAAADAA